MRLTIFLFAQLADSIGARAIEIEMHDGATVADLLRELEAKHPSITALRGRLAVAIDERYARQEEIVRAGQTIALIPPVSGG
jgi:molybdopterin converting factor subunit 1